MYWVNIIKLCGVKTYTPHPNHHSMYDLYWTSTTSSTSSTSPTWPTFPTRPRSPWFRPGAVGNRRRIWHRPAHVSQVTFSILTIYWLIPLIENTITYHARSAFLGGDMTMACLSGIGHGKKCKATHEPRFLVSYYVDWLIIIFHLLLSCSGMFLHANVIDRPGVLIA